MTMRSQSYAPRSGDEKLIRGGVSIDQVKSAGASAQGGTRILLTGSLPTPCHELRLEMPHQPSAGGVLHMKAWSVTDPDVLCAQVLQPFSVEVPLPAGLVDGDRAASAIAINDSHYELKIP